MVNGTDPTRRRHLRVLKLKASRLKLPIDPAIACEMETTTTTTTTTTTISVESSTTTVAITPSPLSPSLPACTPPIRSTSPTLLNPLTTSEQKKQARQIRNRQAAITSRQRYLADTELLKQRVAKLEAENKSLLEYIAKLHYEKVTPVNFDYKLPKPDIFCSKEHATFYLRGISPIVPSHCREINMQ
jgi:hypothetical protein